jgi:hypothetical protein
MLGKAAGPASAAWRAYIIWLAPVLDIFLAHFNILKIAPFVETGVLASLLGRLTSKHPYPARGVDTDPTANLRAAEIELSPLR